MVSCGFSDGVFWGAGSYVFMGAWNTGSLSDYRLGGANQGSRYDIDQSQGAVVNGSSRQINKFSLWNGYGAEYDFILTLSIFIQIWFILRLATMSPCKADTPIFVDNKE